MLFPKADQGTAAFRTELVSLFGRREKKRDRNPLHTGLVAHPELAGSAEKFGSKPVKLREPSPIELEVDDREAGVGFTPGEPSRSPANA